MDGLVKAPRESRKLGFLRDHEAYFENEKQKIFAKFEGGLDELRLTYNRILIAQWYTESARFQLDSSKTGIIMPDTSVDNEKWTGFTGLILKMGPHAYEDNEHIKWYPDEVAKVGDWVIYRMGDGTPMLIWNQICTLVENEHAIRAIVTRPDIV